MMRGKKNPQNHKAWRYGRVEEGGGRRWRFVPRSTQRLVATVTHGVFRLAVDVYEADDDDDPRGRYSVAFRCERSDGTVSGLSLHAVQTMLVEAQYLIELRILCKPEDRHRYEGVFKVDTTKVE